MQPISELSHLRKPKLYPVKHQLLVAAPPQVLAVNLCLRFLTILGTSEKWNPVVFVLCAWLISLSTMSSRSIQLSEYPFLRLNNIPLHIDHFLAIRLLLDTWVASISWPSGIMPLSMNVGVQMSVRSCFVSFGCITRQWDCWILSWLSF